jgi:hypothetical protein
MAAKAISAATRNISYLSRFGRANIGEGSLPLHF